MACGILVPQPGIEHVPPALEVWSLNHREVSEILFKIHIRSCHSFAQNSPMAPSSLRIKAKALTVAQKSLHNLVPIISLTLPPITFPITHCSPATLASLLFLKHVVYPPSSEPLYLLVSLSRTLFFPDNLMTCPPTSSRLKCHLPREAFPDKHI